MGERAAAEAGEGAAVVVVAAALVMGAVGAVPVEALEGEGAVPREGAAEGERRLFSKAVISSDRAERCSNGSHVLYLVDHP